MVVVSDLFESPTTPDKSEYYLVMRKRDNDLYPGLALHLTDKNSVLFKLVWSTIEGSNGTWLSEEEKAGLKVFENVDDMVAYIHALDYGEIEVDEMKER